MSVSLSQVSLISRGYGGRGILAVSVQTSQLQSKRNTSEVKFLKKTDLGSLKRGRGGRSSFSGTVATVFGATGFFGKYVCNKLGKAGTQMIIPYRGDSYETRPLKVAGDLGQVLFQPFHLCDEDSIRNSIKYSDVVINLVGRDYETRNFNFNKVHVDGSARIARICKEMGVEKLIHVSALNSDREHEGFKLEGGSQFLKSKGEGERLVREAFPEAIIFRPSDVFGEEDRFLQYFARAARRSFTSMSLALPMNGENIWKQPVSVIDVAQGIVNAINDPNAVGNTYEAVGPRRYELVELVDYLYRVMRRERPEFFRYDMKWNPFYYTFVTLNEKLSMSDPLGWVTRDKLEREVVTDVTSDLPNLTDLGVDLNILEDRIHFEMKNYKYMEYYYAKVGEHPEPVLPKYVDAYATA